MPRFRNETHRIAVFWSKIDKRGPDECWPWRGFKDRYGYGRTGFRGEHSQLAHRIAFFLTFGDFDKSLFVLHSCDNRPCCNPRHLRSGTAKDNADDCISRGRKVCSHAPRPTCRGERHHKAKVTADDVRAIRARRGESNKRIGQDFGLTKGAVWRIMAGVNWKHVV